MKTFKDTEGREWIVRISTQEIKAVKNTVGIDLLKIVEDFSVVNSLYSDPITLVDTVYVVCRKQAEERGVTDEQFGAAMAGDAIDHATTALLEELTSFFPVAKRRVLQSSLTKLKELEAQTIEAACKEINNKNFDAELAEAFGKLDTLPLTTSTDA